MNLIHWNDEIYSVGITKLDAQHKQLVDLINAIEKCKDRSEKEFIEKVLKTLASYISDHFECEEKILEKIGFNETNQHKSMHRVFAQRIENAIDQFHQSEDYHEKLPSLLQFLRNWITTHILIEDMKYKNYLFS